MHWALIPEGFVFSPLFRIYSAFLPIEHPKITLGVTHVA